jgi:hypothetical protein
MWFLGTVACAEDLEIPHIWIADVVLSASILRELKRRSQVPGFEHMDEW